MSAPDGSFVPPDRGRSKRVVIVGGVAGEVGVVTVAADRGAIGFGAAVVLGVPLGLTLGWYPAADQVVNPVMQILRPISPIAWIPVAIIFFGIGDHAAIFLIFLGAFFPIVVGW